MENESLLLTVFSPWQYILQVDEGYGVEMSLKFAPIILNEVVILSLNPISIYLDEYCM